MAGDQHPPCRCRHSRAQHGSPTVTGGGRHMTGHCHAVISWQESPGGRVTVRCDCAAYTPAPAETDWSRCGYSVDCLRTPAVALALPDGQPKPYCTEHANSVRKFALKDVPRSLA